jgi:DNA-binding transcriptional LysR family regulator
MDIKDLRSVIAIAEAGSLSSAARKLNLTQPALSTSLRRLEEELGVELVKRHSRGSVLTEEGRFVLQRAYGILNDVTEVVSVVQNMAHQPIGTVRLGLPTTVAGGLIPAFFPTLQSRFPQIKLHIIEAMSGTLAELLQLGRIDLAILFDIQPMAGLRSEPLLKEKHYLLVPREHELAGRTSLRLEEVARIGVVMPSKSNSIRRYIDATCAAEGINMKVIADIDSLPGLINLTLSGYCTILPTYLVTEHIKHNRIVAIPISRPELEWTLHLASRHEVSRLQATLATSQHLIEVCRKLVISGSWPASLAR